MDSSNTSYASIQHETTQLNNSCHHAKLLPELSALYTQLASTTAVLCLAEWAAACFCSLHAVVAYLGHAPGLITLSACVTQDHSWQEPLLWPAKQIECLSPNICSLSNRDGDRLSENRLGHFQPARICPEPRCLHTARALSAAPLMTAWQHVHIFGGAV